MLYITSDHGGYNLKKDLLIDLRSTGIEVTDLGPDELNEADDYPKYTLLLIDKLKEDITDNKGIIICRNGVGVSMLANKFNGIRAALSWTPEHAASSRTDDDSNVLALPADYVDLETASQIVRKWLQTDFSKKEKHSKRLDTVQKFGQ